MTDSAESDEGVARSVSQSESTHSVLSIFKDWYHVPALVAVTIVMLAIRLQSYDRFIRGSDVLFSGNDPWYHFREVTYTVLHWPATMPFDPWTYFPFGTNVGQFGTLYDQIVATAALIVGLGHPSHTLVAKTLLVAPAVFGAAAAIPAYLIGKRLGGRLSGLFGAVLLMLMPGVFLQRTLVGVADHNGAEPFFQAMAVVALIAAFAIAEREKPIWELVVDRELDALRRPLVWAVLAGIATALYMWMWPPGVLLVGVVGVFLVVKITSDVVNDQTPEPIAFAGAVSMTVTAALMFLPLQAVGFSPTSFTLVQPLVALVVGVGGVFLAWLARQWESRDLDPTLYPVAVFGIILAGFVFIWAAMRPLWYVIANNLLRTVGFSAGAQTRTIGEAQPYLSPDILRQRGLTPANQIISDYGFTLFSAIVGAIWFLGKPLIDDGDTRKLGYAGASIGVTALLFLVPAIPDGLGKALGVDSSLVSLAIVTALILGAVLLEERPADRLFVLVWASFITSAAFTQVRFNYYLAVPVVVLNAYLLGQILTYLDLRSIPEKASDVKGYQVVAVLAVVLVVAAPVLLVPIGIRNTGQPQYDKSATAWQAAQNGPGAVTQWDGSLQWLNNSTPQEGRFGGASNPLQYYGSYKATNDFSYPKGSYGVMSWWDYGHWITVRGHRIPNANPFQQGAKEAANFLLAPNEKQASKVVASKSTEGNDTRFVMVDWKMVTPGSKFGAPVVFYDAGNLSRSEMLGRIYKVNNKRQITGSFEVRHQRYYRSLMVRLYEYEGSSMSPQPIVVDWDNATVDTNSGPVTIQRTPVGNQSTVLTFNNMSAARAYVRRDGTSQVGGIGKYPSKRVPALQHYRLVKTSSGSALQSRQYQSSIVGTARAASVSPQALMSNSPAWVKTYERVPGATVEGSGAPANATVTASVQMYAPTQNSTFTYTQQATADANGHFTMVLPYSTAGYDKYGPQNGYTNVSVRAKGPYKIRTNPTLRGSNVTYRSANLSVPEGLVNGAQKGPATVTLQKKSSQITINKGSNSGQSSGSPSSSGSSTKPSGSSSNASGDLAPSVGAVGLAADARTRSARP
ncbi:MAG: oligosaccharyl transferase, archaeosortase A system-associated [Salinigranum sp.]